MTTHELVRAAATAVEIGGVTIIVAGIVISIIRATRAVVSNDASKAYTSLRRRIGRSILLGLELLLAADIIRTVAEAPTLTSVAILAAIVLIRTFLSFTIETELTGRLPWRSSGANTPAA